MSVDKRWQVRIEHILEAIGKIERYTSRVAASLAGTAPKYPEGKPITLPLSRRATNVRLFRSHLFSKREKTMRWLSTVLLLLLAMPVHAQANEVEKLKPLPPEIVKLWQDAGADVGWMKMDKVDFVGFQAQEKVEAGAMPAFRFSPWKKGVLAKLPDPGVAFELDLGHTRVMDAGLKELSGLKSLQALNLYRTLITDAGLKELAELKSLHYLALSGTKVTEAGVGELRKLRPDLTISYWKR